MGTSLKKEVTSKDSPGKDRSVSILLVEDNPGDAIIIREMLNSSALDFTLERAATLKEAIILCTDREYDIILLDLGLPDSTGLDVLKKIQVFNMKATVIVLTGLDDEDAAIEALKEGAQDYLSKNRLTTDYFIRGIKYGIERKKINDLLIKNAKQFSLLSLTATALNDCEDVASIYDVACRHIKNVIDKAGIVAMDLGNEGKSCVSGMEYLEPMKEAIKSATGINPADLSNFSTELKTGIVYRFNDGKLHYIVFKSPDTALAGQDNISSVNPETPLFNIYAMGFFRRNIVYGGMLIFCPKTINAEERSLIETVGKQVSSLLHRRKIEHDLKSSEASYRKLSEELEHKVKERTRDLEQSNYRLKLELNERHQAEDALRKSETRLRELNKTKDTLFSIIAHDLKNPFTCLLGSTEILLSQINGMTPDEIRELAQILNDSAKSGYSILQNLLDWSRSQTGMIVLHPENINLKSIIEENIIDLKYSSDQKEIEVTSEIQEDLNIITDKNLLNAILRNLLNNAVKFTHNSGKVSVTATRANNEVTVSVKDTGIGIPESEIDELFGMENGHTRPGTNMEQGTGLGLKICREFVEMLGGVIWAESTDNEGSNFTFTLPVR